jgi:glycosyltransferase involved in cell wall biosynthesis
LESISCGNPVICSDIPPLKSIILGTKCGVVLDDWETGFSDAVKKATACEGCSNKVMEWMTIAEKYVKVYSECI